MHVQYTPTASFVPSFPVTVHSRISRRGIHALIVAVITVGGTPAAAEVVIGNVTRVHDGDTLTVLYDGRPTQVRLADIDAPELGQPFGRRSRDFLTAMCLHATATVEERARDRYAASCGK